jgi:AcrR family transcriptional regulator
VLRGAVAIADERGLAALTMRSLGQQLGVEAMSLYNHVANKDDVLDGLVEVVMGEVVAAAEQIPPPADPSEWKAVMRARILAAREVLLRHRWAPGLMETRSKTPSTVMRYFDSVLGLMLQGGFSIDLAHHAMHALGSRAFGFSQELFVEGDGDPEPEVSAMLMQQLAAHYPNLAALMRVISHDADSTIGGCDDQFEFEFGLDLILDGLERLRVRESS